MTFTKDKLLDLLPAIYRIRDQEAGGPLSALLAVLAEQIGVLEEDLAQSYDDNFIETSAEWVVPYIGDLVAARGVYDLQKEGISQRAQVANTLYYRRRKGTLTVLEQLARDVTGWNAHAVEYFQKLRTTQYMNHLRPGNLSTPDLRRMEPLEYYGSALDAFAHSGDIRRIAVSRGKYNIPNIGIFLWRIPAYSLTLSPAAKVDARRFFFHPLGIDCPLYTNPQTEDQLTHFAGPLNLPLPISRRILAAHLGSYYGSGNSVSLNVGGVDINAGQIAVCDLSDSGGTWAHLPKTKYAIDPVLGRLALPEKPDPAKPVLVSFHYGFPADMGGGEYDRLATFTAELKPVASVPSQFSSIQTALDSLTGGGVVEIAGSGRYAETLSIHAPAGKHIEIRAADLARPTVILSGDLKIAGDAGSEVTINGLLISGGRVQATGSLQTLRIVHSTLVPDTQPALLSAIQDLSVLIDHSITGALSVDGTDRLKIENSIVDALKPGNSAIAAGTLTVETSTVIGTVQVQILQLASNTIFISDFVHADRRQEGCVRFCYLPADCRVPRRFHCQPVDESARPSVQPLFNSLRYGSPAYCQLSRNCSQEVRTGASDGPEMGTYHDLFEPQRETNLRVRLAEYLRFGLEAGIFYAS